MNHKAGFVNIIGNPNVGKSTLMNRLVGEKISIITSKSQTTRHRIKGIVNTDDYQIVYSDTPGVIKPSYKLQESMMNFSISALVDADVIIYVTDTVEKFDKNEAFLSKVQKTSAPVLLVINKIDLSDDKKLEELFTRWEETLPNAVIYPISAKENFNLDNLLNKIVELIPEGDPFFPKDEITDLPARFFVNEIIREKILLNYDKEVPYSVEVQVEEFIDEPKIIRISAVIHVERESQKGIIIGKRGEALKRVGTQARKDIENFFGKKVFLQIHVKLSKDWRSKEKNLQNFGYSNN
ncbi:MAG: GTPase Era [Marinifilaceae bacterium]|jgi:GTP-binding protein Era|nr:GTPase Era [Marinifilaceae bacterium]